MENKGWTKVAPKKKTVAAATMKKTTPTDEADTSTLKKTSEPKVIPLDAVAPFGKWLSQPNRRHLYKETRQRATTAEWVEKYRPGGLHPIDIGDRLAEGRFTVLRKLGHGVRSTT